MLESHLFTEARLALEKGDLNLAEHCSSQLLRLLPENADVWLLTGEIHEARNRFDQAIDCFVRVQRRHPKDPVVQVRLGQCLARAGRLDEAAKHFRKALKLKPAFTPALGNLGLLALQARQLDEAGNFFYRILKIDPNDVSSWLNMGNVHAEAQRWQEAEKCYRRVIALAPDFAGAHGNLGNVLKQQGRSAEAMICYRHSLSLEPANAELWLNVGDVLYGNRDWAEAEAAYDRALSLDPHHEDGYRLMGKLLLELHRPSDAVHFYRRQLVLSADIGDVWINLSKCYLDIALSGDALSQRTLEGIDGATLKEAGVRLAAARESLLCTDRALIQKPHDPAALCNRVIALKYLGRHDEAEAAGRAAVSTQTVLAQTHFELASLLLSRGQFLQGWKAYPWRLKLHNVLSALPEIATGTAEVPVPLELAREAVPTNFAGKRILVVWDQGIGDEIFFLRFLPLLKARGAWVAYWSSPKIRPLLERVGCIDAIVDKTSIPSNLDMVVTVGDLPCLLAEADTPSPLVLRPHAARVQALRDALPASFQGRPLLGVTWRAGMAKQAGVAAWMNKQISPGVLGQCLSAWKGEFVILQRGPTPEEIRDFETAVGRPVVDASGLNEDLDGMLAMLAILDDYVGVSNTNVHLRAGLARCARVLACYPPEWRWMAAGKCSPWFPEFSVYRESLDTGWSKALACLAQDIT